MTVHAHPDDETIGTGGLMAKAVAAGHRVILVTGTRGELGEIVVKEMDTPDNHRRLGEIRAGELEAAMGELGVTEWENLGYRDSGMMGTDGNRDPRCYWQADLDEAARRLTWLVRRYRPDVMTTYNDFGGYGHPDHIQVHNVGVRAAELAGVSHVYEATVNRDQMARLMASNPQWAADAAPPDVSEFGLPESEITTVVDVRPAMAAKRAAMAAHESQVGDFGPFLAMPAEQVEAAFGQEWFRRRGGATGQEGSDVLETALPL